MSASKYETTIGNRMSKATTASDGMPLQREGVNARKRRARAKQGQRAVGRQIDRTGAGGGRGSRSLQVRDEVDQIKRLMVRGMSDHDIRRQMGLSRNSFRHRMAMLGQLKEDASHAFFRYALGRQNDVRQLSQFIDASYADVAVLRRTLDATRVEQTETLPDGTQRQVTVSTDPEAEARVMSRVSNILARANKAITDRANIERDRIHVAVELGIIRPGTDANDGDQLDEWPNYFQALYDADDSQLPTGLRHKTPGRIEHDDADDDDARETDDEKTNGHAAGSNGSKAAAYDEADVVDVESEPSDNGNGNNGSGH